MLNTGQVDGSWILELLEEEREGGLGVGVGEYKEGKG
jgi:hypothetical protein